jgi:hypothetical protein
MRTRFCGAQVIEPHDFAITLADRALCAAVGMILYMAPAGADEVAALGDKPDDEALMAILEREESLCLDKLWDATLSLFEEGAHPFEGMEPVTGDIGYGPAMFIDAERVRTTAARLSMIEATTFDSRFNPAELAARDAYPAIWERPDEMPEIKREVLATANDVIRLYERASVNGQGVLVAML